MRWRNGCRKRWAFIGVLVVVAFGGGRVKADFVFGAPTNLGPIVNSPYRDFSASISGDGLSLFVDSRRSGGSGDYDLWVTTRPSKDDGWSAPVNLGPTVNSSVQE